MKLSLAFSDDLDASGQRSLAQAAEADGFHSLWCSESNSRDGLLLSLLRGLSTEHLKVGLGVASIWTRTPPQVAMATAALQDATGGRFLLGLGSSHLTMVEGWHGRKFDSPLQAMREFLTVIRQIEVGETSEFQGSVFASNGFSLRVTPLPPPAPIYLAAMGPQMLMLSGRMADGALLNWVSAMSIASSRQTIHEAAQSEGRSPTDVEIGSYVRIAVHPSRDVALAALARELASYCRLPLYKNHFERQGFGEAVGRVNQAVEKGADDLGKAEALGEELLGSMGWAGTPEQSPADYLGGLRDAGLDHAVARVVVCEGDPQESLIAARSVLVPLLSEGRLATPAGRQEGP